jgi:hypothetical protein
VADSVCEPTESAVVLNTATPAAFKFALPIKVVPSKKLTAPNAAPVGEGETVAVSKTACPTTAGFGVAESTVVVEMGETVSVLGDEVEVAKLESPE